MGPRGIKMWTGEGSTMRNFIVSSVLLIARVNKFRKLRYAGFIARIEGGRSAFRILKGKPT